MRKIAEKVAIVALVCITFVFVLTTILYITNTINNYNLNEFYDENGVLLEIPNNSIEIVLMFVLAIVYVLLAIYVLYINFAERENLRSVLLYCDSDSATRTGIKVINRIVKGCSAQMDGISVRKIRIRSDEKGGLSATVYVKVSAEEVSEKVNAMRALLLNSFKSTLNLTFNTMNFHIDKLEGRYAPDVPQAEKTAEILQDNQETVTEIYQDPLKKIETSKEEQKKENNDRQNTDEKTEKESSLTE